MNISTQYSTPKCGLSDTKQAARESGASQKFSGAAQIARQLHLWESQQKSEYFALQKYQKPQIKSIPGTSPKQRDRYRVVWGGQILGDQLSIDEALALAKRGGRNAKNLPKSDFYS